MEESCTDILHSYSHCEFYGSHLSKETPIIGLIIIECETLKPATCRINILRVGIRITQQMPRLCLSFYLRWTSTSIGIGIDTSDNWKY